MWATTGVPRPAARTVQCHKTAQRPVLFRCLNDATCATGGAMSRDDQAADERMQPAENQVVVNS
jgi:hypothetical protein